MLYEVKYMYINILTVSSIISLWNPPIVKFPSYKPSNQPSCKISSKSLEWFRRSRADKKYGPIDGQTDRHTIKAVAKKGATCRLRLNTTNTKE